MGGFVKCVTKQPSLDDFAGSARADGSSVDDSDSGFGVRASVSIPVVRNTAAVSATGFYREGPGFVDNVFKGVRNINHDHVDGARVSARVRFSDDLESTLSGLVQHTHSDGPNL